MCNLSALAGLLLCAEIFVFVTVFQQTWCVSVVVVQV